MTRVKSQDYINEIIKKQNSKSVSHKKVGLQKALSDNKIAVGKPKKTLAVK